MYTVPLSYLQDKQAFVTGLDNTFEAWKPHLQRIAEYFLPRRYEWMDTSYIPTSQFGNAQQRNNKGYNTKILDPYGTTSIRSLAAGMLNSITSPTRPWFSINLSGLDPNALYVPVPVKRWKQEVLKRMFAVLAGSNFYNAMAIKFLDLCCFGSALMIIYEDFDDIIRCHNIPVGEFRFWTNSKNEVEGISRTFSMTVKKLVDTFGMENVSSKIQSDYKNRGTRLNNRYTVRVVIEPNSKDEAFIEGGNAYRELIFEIDAKEGKLLRHAPFKEKPFGASRWEITGSDEYGSSPAMDALPTVIELQQVVLEKGRAIAYMNRPPVVADNVFKSKPNALLPGGKTFVNNSSAFGAKAVYTVNPPMGELRNDINEIHQMIDVITHNDLFRMISNLDTVRSATEIDARREEKIVQLAAVLERFEGEVLSPAIIRVFNIMERLGLFPERPAELEGLDIEIEYESILTAAQRSLGTATTERFLQLIAESGSVWQELLDTVEPSEIIRDYADRLNVPAMGIRSREEVARKNQENAEAQQLQQTAAVGNDLAGAASNLANTDVGGGQNALSRLLS